MAKSVLPPTPFQAPIIRENGFLNQRWVGFFREAFDKIGGSAGLTIVELNEMAEELSDKIDVLSAQVAALNSSLSGGNELNQGPVL